VGSGDAARFTQRFTLGLAFVHISSIYVAKMRA